LRQALGGKRQYAGVPAVLAGGGSRDCGLGEGGKAHARDPACHVFTALAEMRRESKRSPSTGLYDFLWDKSEIT
jgi:hypothetical protein